MCGASEQPCALAAICHGVASCCSRTAAACERAQPGAARSGRRRTPPDRCRPPRAKPALTGASPAGGPAVPPDLARRRRRLVASPAANSRLAALQSRVERESCEQSDGRCALGGVSAPDPAEWTAGLRARAVGAADRRLAGGRASERRRKRANLIGELHLPVWLAPPSPGFLSAGHRAGSVHARKPDRPAGNHADRLRAGRPTRRSRPTSSPLKWVNSAVL
mgnify:CR=1 FL=1